MTVKMPPDFCDVYVRTDYDPAEERWQVELVLKSIEDIEWAFEKWRKTEVDASSTETERGMAARLIAYRLNDFSGQWQNVKAILSRIKDKN